MLLIISYTETSSIKTGAPGQAKLNTVQYIGLNYTMVYSAHCQI